jgi:hypothetical protein
VTVEADQATAGLTTSNAALTFSGTLKPGDHVFETSNGSVDLRFPADAAFTIDATTSNAEATSEFPVDGTSTKTDLHGTVGPKASAAAVTIRARTTNGALSVKRA